MKHLDEIKIGKRLSDEEMKQIQGELGLELIGARCHNGQCYCDLPCVSSACWSMGIPC